MRRKVVLSDNEDVSPNKVNLFRPRYTKLPSANLPDMVKPATDMEEIDMCIYQDGRGDWRERASKEHYGIWEILSVAGCRRSTICKGSGEAITRLVCGKGSRSGP